MSNLAASHPSVRGQNLNPGALDRWESLLAVGRGRQELILYAGATPATRHNVFKFNI